MDRIANRYDVVKQLGQGGQSAVFLAVDRKLGCSVALKRVALAKSDCLVRDAQLLTDEFRRLASLRHPHICQVRDYGVEDDGGSAYFTMEVVEGVPFLDAVRGEPHDRIVGLAAQVLRALDHVHGRGLRHGDVKSENVLVERKAGGAEERAVLVDFGLSSDGRIGDETPGFRGTLRYAAPELLGSGHPVDSRADLYAVGILLDRALRGAFPFDDSDRAATREFHLKTAPPELPESVPASLAAYVRRLLAKDPSERFASAREALRGLAAATGLALPLDSAEIRSATLTTGPLVGRALHLAALEKAFGSLGEGTPVAKDPGALRGPQPDPAPPAAFLLRGEPGSGKTRLLSEFRRTVQTRGGRFLLASGEPDAPSAYGPLRPVLVEAALLCGDASPVLARLGRDLRPVVPDLPYSESRPPAAPAPSGSVERNRFFEAATQLLFEVSRSTPTVLAFDDAHWLDQETREFLGYLARNLRLAAKYEVERPRLLVVIAEDSDDTPDSRDLCESLREEFALETLLVENMTRPDLAAYLEAVFGGERLSPATVDRFFERTGGNPFLLDQLLRTLAEDGRISAASEGGGFAAVVKDLDSVELSMGAARSIRSRLEKLTACERAVLDAHAVAGFPLDERSLSALVAEHKDGAAAAAESLVAGGFLERRRPKSGRPATAFRNRSLREGTYAALDPETRERLHRRMGEALLAEDGPATGERTERIAVHLLRGRDGKRGPAWALEAARALRSLGATERALKICTEALAVLPRAAGSAKLRRKIADAAADACAALGQGQKAIEYWRQVLRGEGAELTKKEKSDVLGKVGNVWFSRGDAQRARRFFLRAGNLAQNADVELRASLMARTARAEGTLGRIERGLALAREAGTLVAPRSKAPAEAAPAAEPMESAPSGGQKHVRALIESLEVEGELLHRKGDFKGSVRVFEKVRSLALASGDLAAAAVAENHLGNNKLRLGDLSGAREGYEKSLRLRERLGDFVGIGASYNNLGIVCRQRNDFSGAVEYYRQSVAYGERAGDRPGLANVYNNLGNIYYYSCRYDRAEEYYRRSLELFERIGDPNGIARVKNNLGGVYRIEGDYSRAIRCFAECLGIRRDMHTKNRVVATRNNLAETLVDIGDYDGAATVLTGAREEAIAAGLRFEQADAQRLLGTLAARRGAANEAMPLLRLALDEFSSIGKPVDAAFTRLEIADLRFKAGEEDAGKEELRAAVKVADEIEAPDLAVACDLMKARYGIDEGGGDRSRRTAFLRGTLGRSSRIKNRRFILQAHAMLGRFYHEEGDCEEALNYYIKVMEMAEAIWKRLDDPNHKESFLNVEEVREVFRGVKALERDLRLKGTGLEGKLLDAFTSGWTQNLFTDAKASLYEIERRLDISKERFDKKNAGLKRILEISEIMNSTLDVDKLFRLIVDRVLDLTKAERGFVVLLDEQSKLDVKVAHEAGRKAIENVESEISHTIVSQVMRERKPLLFQDAGQVTGLEDKHSVIKLDLRSIMCVPMIHKDRLHGVVYVDNRTTVGQFDEGDLELLSIFANQAAMALENTRLFEHLETSYRNLKDTHEQLVRSERLRALGEMAGGVAHDFNNLLASILGRAQLLKMQATDDKTRRELEIIEKAALDGADTIKRIQDFTRVRKDQNFVPVDMNAIARDVLDFTRTRWKDEVDAQGLRMHVTTDLEPVPAVDANPAEVREALTNIVINALDAMPSGGHLQIRSLTDLRGRVTICVTDTGTGMTEEVRQRIFDPFFTTKGNRGNGLGMSIVYGIVSRHRGDIEVESEVGKGTTVRLVFPPSSQALSSIAKPAAEAPRQGEGRVVVIDDDAGVCRLITEVLTKVGYDVTSHTDSRQGVEACLAAAPGTAASPEAKSIDLLITDLGMPGITGFEVARQVKRKDPHVSVALITGWAVELDDQKVRTNGIDLVITKPFDIHDLLRIVEAGVRMGRRRRSGEEPTPEPPSEEMAPGTSGRLKRFEPAAPSHEPKVAADSAAKKG